MRSRRKLLLAVFLVMGCALPATLVVACPGPSIAEVPRDSAHLKFEQHEVTTGTAKSQTVLPGFFLAGAVADLAVVSTDENDDRRLRIFSFGDGAWAQSLEATLRPGVLFVDLANIGGRDRLITFERGRLNWFDPESGTERALVGVATIYNATPAGLSYAGTDEPSDEGDIPHVEITRDLNCDGRDDLIVPHVDGFQVFIQMSDGAFADPVKLGPPEPFRDEIAAGDTRSYGQVGISPLTIPWYLSRVHQMDYDQDGRSDLVFWNEDHFDVYRQDERGLFSPLAETFTVDVPFDSDGAYSLLFGFGEESVLSLVFGFGEKSSQTVLTSVRDMNGDGVADLVTHSLEGRGLRHRSRYAVHFGTPTPGGIAFSRDPGTAVQPQVRAGRGELAGYSSLWLRDFDGDGQVDILRGDVGFGVGDIIRGLLRSSISMGAELYRMDDGVYPEKATTRHKTRIKIKTKPTSGPEGGRDAGFFPAVLVGDVNGDGRSDVLVGKSREELHVYLGGSGPEVLARDPRSVAVALPGDERNSWLADLNRDGKQDILLHHPPIDQAPHRVTTLISR